MSTFTMTVNFEDMWCKSCGQPTIVAVSLMNAKRDQGKDVFCSACGRRYGLSEQIPTKVINDQREQLERGYEDRTKLEHQNAGLRGALARSKKRGGK